MTVGFRAMGTDVSVVVPGATPVNESHFARIVATIFENCEARFSRFRPESELSRLNQAEGPMVVSPEMMEVLTRAQAHHDATRGVFDPAVGNALLAAGYDRSFAPGALDRVDTLPSTGTRQIPFGAIEVDFNSRTVRRPPGVTIDLGGLVKGWTVDLASRLLPTPSAVDAGGDAALLGGGDDGEGWLVDVEDPFDPDDVLLTLRVRDRAVATSAPNRRNWVVGGERRHHLIDPRIGQPARSDLAQVTVLAPTAEEADVLAKTTYLLGSRAGWELLATRGRSGVLVHVTGHVETVGLEGMLLDA